MSMQNTVRKFARVEMGHTPREDDLALINRQTLRPLTADEVFTFRLAACDDQVDRDLERFTLRALEEMAERYVGRPLLMDHHWSAHVQTGRVYAARVGDRPEGGKRLELDCYIPKLDQTAQVIAAIESGLLRECSVGCAAEQSLCSICGQSFYGSNCMHIKGREYDGKRCVVELDGCADVYEVSLVAVPAQREAGVVKGADPREDRAKADQKKELEILARAEQELEAARY